MRATMAGTTSLPVDPPGHHHSRVVCAYDYPAYHRDGGAILHDHHHHHHHHNHHHHHQSTATSLQVGGGGGSQQHTTTSHHQSKRKEVRFFSDFRADGKEPTTPTSTTPTKPFVRPSSSRGVPPLMIGTRKEQHPSPSLTPISSPSSTTPSDSSPPYSPPVSPKKDTQQQQQQHPSPVFNSTVESSSSSSSSTSKQKSKPPPLNIFDHHGGSRPSSSKNPSGLSVNVNSNDHAKQQPIVIKSSTGTSPREQQQISSSSPSISISSSSSPGPSGTAPQQQQGRSRTYSLNLNSRAISANNFSNSTAVALGNKLSEPVSPGKGQPIVNPVSPRLSSVSPRAKFPAFVYFPSTSPSVKTPSSLSRTYSSLGGAPKKTEPIPPPQLPIYKATTSMPLINAHFANVLSPRRRSKSIIVKESDAEEFLFIDYAKQNFEQRSKKSLIRKRNVTYDMLVSFAKKLSSPLHKFNDANLEKLSLEIFNHILMYMGDQERKKSLASTAIYIVKTALEHIDLRDEVYCQLVKQITRHPKRENKIRGWELLSICCGSFPPNQRLLKHLSLDDLRGIIVNFIMSLPFYGSAIFLDCTQDQWSEVEIAGGAFDGFHVVIDINGVHIISKQAIDYKKIDEYLLDDDSNIPKTPRGDGENNNNNNNNNGTNNNNNNNNNNSSGGISTNVNNNNNNNNNSNTNSSDNNNNNNNNNNTGGGNNNNTDNANGLVTVNPDGSMVDNSIIDNNNAVIGLTRLLIGQKPRKNFKVIETYKYSQIASCDIEQDGKTLSVRIGGDEEDLVLQSPQCSEMAVLINGYITHLSADSKCAIAIRDYSIPSEPFSFKKGNLLTITERGDLGWCSGTVKQEDGGTGVVGNFPLEYVRILIGQPTASASSETPVVSRSSQKKTSRSAKHFDNQANSSIFNIKQVENTKHPLMPYAINRYRSITAVKLGDILKHTPNCSDTNLFISDLPLEIQKDIGDLFIEIMKYMGDIPLPPKERKSRLLQNIIQRCINKPRLRDDIYFFICRQLTLNPNSEGTRKGILLFSLCAGCFPATAEFFPYIRQFLAALENKYTKQCIVKLQATSLKGPRLYGPSKKRDTCSQGKQKHGDQDPFGQRSTTTNRDWSLDDGTRSTQDDLD
ncbi:hypothetical protein DFA_11322 [Cavenderia fasciculata]|uniref:SH3 domain-containing protein n=1 Tax=Cavenderia fasciculata TaxID=261658 RepID=F4QCC6_CACFS|nr:uncharacterized protein DFA_11322 [Cavenderia fasciculata]EGG13561.1 hypothetical protein DFA_11322 [Cavenderia fasciculata]|eukprot:XP_004350265.1 hypothetical protein DFA_11322 [Cavenderia fasciculata]